MKRMFLMLMLAPCVLISCTKNNAEKYSQLMEQAYESKDYDLMAQYAQKGAALGNRDAQYWMGWFSEKDGSSVDAIDWYVKAANQGHVSSMYRLGRLYLLGSGAHDYEVAKKWLTAAVSQGNDDEEVVDALEGLPETGDYVALYRRALIEVYCLDAGVDVIDFPLAFMYALKGGFVDIEHIDTVLENFGLFVPVELLEGSLETEAEKKAILCFFADTVFDSIQKSEESLIKNASIKDYIVVYEKSAEDGNGVAQYLLAKLYGSGVGVAFSEKKAKDFYTFAMSQGFN